jgi:hypothetical protein
MKITKTKFYDGALEKVTRLGLSRLYFELQEILFSTDIRLLEEKDANGAGIVRKMIDAKFEETGGWVGTKSGGTDWVKKIRYNQTILSRIGVEIQVSARSDMIIRDIVHLRNSIDKGEIDVGVMVVPDDRLQVFLPDRTPSFRDAVRYIEEEFKEAMNFPIILIAIEHDGPGEALKKQIRKA